MSLPLAIVLALTPPAPPPPILPPPTIERRLAPRSCSDIDPRFALYVPPPAGIGPIWPIERMQAGRPGPSFDARDLDFGPAVKGKVPAKVPPLACPRLIPADRG